MDASRRTCTILGVIGGCGCLLLIAIIVALYGGVAWFTNTIEETGPVNVMDGGEVPGVQEQGVPDEVLPPPEPPIDAEDAPAGDEEAPAAATPGEEAAKAAALEAINEPGWVTRVEENSPDWRRVVVWAGPPQSEWVYTVTLQWDERLRGYALESTAAIDYPGFD